MDRLETSSTPEGQCGISSELSRACKSAGEGIRDIVVPLVADTVKLHPDVILAEGRGPRPVAEARQLAVALFVTLHAGDHAVRDAAAAFNRDKSTVFHALKAVEERAAGDAGFAAQRARLLDAAREALQ